MPIHSQSHAPQVGQKISVEVWGPYACFSRPELHSEHISYDVPTPSAARCILEAIYWHPGVCYHIDKIQICEPIRFLHLNRNEISSKIARAIPRLTKTTRTADNRDPSAHTPQTVRLLKDVRYIISAHYSLDGPWPSAHPDAVGAIIRRRLERGQCCSQPVFGTREFPAHFGPVDFASRHECPEDLRGLRELGYMLWDVDYSDPKNIHPLFFRATLQEGMLHVPSRSSDEIVA